MPRHSRLMDIFRSHWRAIVLGLVVCVGGGLLYQQIDIDAVHARAEQLNAALAFVLLTLLPLVGFPVTVLHVVIGIRFGGGMGMLLVGVSILLQLLASYALVHVFKDKFARRLKPLRKKIPQGAHGAMCLFAMLLPGVPYFAKNYVLPVLGVPLRTYLLVCLPIHVVRSGVAVFFGDSSDDLTPARMGALALYLCTALFASWWFFRRLRSQMESPPTAAMNAKAA
jgi:uncharacterized membrane protein YdjX (TVP38/TMEM64 family)